MLREPCEGQRYWSGRFDRASLFCRVDAAPGVDRRDDDGRVWISSGGALTERAAGELGELIFRESRVPGTRIIRVTLWCTCCELNGLQFIGAVLNDIPESVTLVARIRVAYGAALALAMRFPIVEASPTAAIGFIECGTENGLLDIELTAHLATELAALRPQVEPEVWGRLLVCHEINGEQAEALGIVDCLRSNPPIDETDGGPAK